jgi:hypothetical protein
MRTRLSLVLLLVFPGGFHPAGAASGWEPYVEARRTSSSAFTDTASRPSVETTEWRVGATGFIRSRHGQLALDGSYGRSDADWGQQGAFSGEIPGMLYDDMEAIAFSAMWTGLPHEQWGYSVLLGFRNDRARDGIWARAGLSDAQSYTFGLATNYRAHSGLVFGLGFLYSSAPAGMDDLLIPIVQVYWKVSEQWTLRTRNGVLLSWESAGERSQELMFSALWESTDWHLGWNGQDEAGYEEEGFTLGVSYAVELAPGLTIRPGLDYLWSREATLWQGGRKLLKSDMEDAWRYSLQVGYRF